MTNYSTDPATASDLGAIASKLDNAIYRLGLVASATDGEVADLDPRFSESARANEERIIRTRRGAEAEELARGVQHFAGFAEVQRKLQEPALRRERARAAAAADPIRDLASATLSARLAHASAERLVEQAEAAARTADDGLAELVLEECEARGEKLDAEARARIQAIADGIGAPEITLATLAQIEDLSARVREVARYIQTGERSAR
jgi:hypothetical protein